MPHYRPRSELETHEVTNQPPPFEDVNLFERDTALHRRCRIRCGDRRVCRPRCACLHRRARPLARQRPGQRSGDTKWLV